IGIELGNKKLKQEVTEQLSAFLTNTAKTQVNWRETTYKALKRQSTMGRKQISQSYQDPKTGERLRLERSTAAPLEIRDSEGVVMAYRFRVPIALIEHLEQSSQNLPPLKNSKHKRGKYALRHYAVWADRQKHVYLSSEYKREKDEADQWLLANKSL